MSGNSSDSSDFEGNAFYNKIAKKAKLSLKKEKQKKRGFKGSKPQKSASSSSSRVFLEDVTLPTAESTLTSSLLGISRELCGGGGGDNFSSSGPSGGISPSVHVSKC